MAEKITFTSAVLKSFTRDHNGCTAQFTASMNANVSKAMKWEDIPECLTGATLEGQLSATTMELVPKETELRKHGIEIDISQVSSFQAIRLELEGKKGKGHRIELRFKVRSAQSDAARRLEVYMATIGEGKSSATVSYTRQENLIPDVEATAEQRAAAMEIN